MKSHICTHCAGELVRHPDTGLLHHLTDGGHLGSRRCNSITEETYAEARA